MTTAKGEEARAIARAAHERIDELLARLGTTDAGLTDDEAARRLERGAPNELGARERSPFVAAAASFFLNPTMLVLVAAAIVAGFLGQTVDAVLIVVMVLLGATLDFVQTFRSANAAARLRDGLAPTAVVLRGGAAREIPRREVVPGDVVRVTAGALVPADCRLLRGRDLHVDQASLTGESLPVEKAPGDAIAGEPAAQPSLLFFGTSVVSGFGEGVVVATGRDTSFADVAASLSAAPPETEFERGMRRFGLLIVQTVTALVLFVFLSAAAFGHVTFTTVMFALALAVGMTPEFLPMITTVTLSRGAVRMARERVIVKNLAAIQNLGSIDVLCSDKTGTLTVGATALARGVDTHGAEAASPIALARWNSRHQSGVESPLDAAILRHAEAAGAGDDATKIDEVPFDFERRRLSVVVDAGGRRRLVTKGAAESVLRACGRVELGGEIAPLDDAALAAAHATLAALGDEGYRVLAVASRDVDAKPAYDVGDERDLVLAGFLAFSDPPKPDAAATIAELAADGVRVKIVTGDDDRVARHVCREVGLDASRVVTGDEVAATSDAALGALAEHASVFARVSPQQKLRVLHALSARGRVVGFLGDGINDAPALHAADVGISVSGAVDVARDAADVILVEPSLRALHRGILEGRRAFGNVVKYLTMGTSSNFGNTMSMAGAMLALPFLPMLPTQILLNNFLYDVAQVTIPTDRVDASFVRIPRKWDIGTIRKLMLTLGPLSSLYDFLTFFVLLRVFRAGEAEFQTGWFIESLATQTLVIFVIRTAGNPLRSRPSAALATTALGVVALAVALPWTALGPAFGFVPLPPSYFAFLFAATSTYLALVAWVRARILRDA